MSKLNLFMPRDSYVNSNMVRREPRASDINVNMPLPVTGDYEQEGCCCTHLLPVGLL